MGRNSGQQQGHGGLRVRVGQDGRRGVNQGYHDHDHPDGAGPSGGGGGGRDYHSSQNRTWTRGGGSGHGGGRDKHVSFNDYRGGGGGRGGGIKKRLGPRGGGRGGSSVHIRPSALKNIGLEDNDDEMRVNRGEGSGYQAGRARPHIRGAKPRRGRGGRGAFISNALVVRRAGGTAGAGAKGWWKVTLLNGSKYPKESILRLLVEKCAEQFAPIAYVKQGPHHVFYVDSRDASRALQAVDQQGLMMSDGFRLNIRVESSPPPAAQINDEMVDKVKLVMSARYAAATKALDLKKFYADANFLGEPVYAPLSRSNVFSQIVKIIGENIPQIEAADLSDNRMRTLDHFATLADKAPNVKILYLADNSIADMKELEKCRSWRLVDLKLSGNPVTTRFKDTAAYQTAVRKIFPSLQFLDGAALPALITFDDDESASSLPPPVLKMSCDPKAEEIVLKFLEQYIGCYDGDGRTALMDAYHDEAVMSMNTAYPPNMSVHGNARLNEYLSESRNLSRVQDVTRRHKLLRQGKLAIVSFLDGLPKTQHDTASFTLDIPFATEKLMTFTVTGVFKERGIRDAPLRHFNRMFVVVPQGQGFVIVNESLFVTMPTPLQLKLAFTGQSPAPAAAPAAGVASPVAAVPTLDAAAIQMNIAQLAQKTGMNENWAKQCLEPNGWDLQKSFEAFETARAQGKIPPEAFVK